MSNIGHEYYEDVKLAAEKQINMLKDKLVAAGCSVIRMKDCDNYFQVVYMGILFDCRLSITRNSMEVVTDIPYTNSITGVYQGKKKHPLRMARSIESMIEVIKDFAARNQNL